MMNGKCCEDGFNRASSAKKVSYSTLRAADIDKRGPLPPLITEQ